MKFNVSIGEFQKILQKILPAIPRKSTLPVLEHYSIRLIGNNLKIIASDQDLIIMSTFTVDGIEDGAVLAPGRKLNDMVKSFNPSGIIEFASSEDNFEIKLKTINGSYNIKGLNPDEYLDMPELFDSEKPVLKEIIESGEDGDIKIFKTENPNAAYFKRSDISMLAEKTYFAVSSDEFRPAMNGVLFQFREKSVTAVSTDSFRLVKATLRSEKSDYPHELDIIIPARTIDLLKKLDDDAVLSTIESHGKKTHVRIDSGNIVIIARLIDERFPPYETVIPQNNHIKAVVKKNDVLGSIRRVAILSNKISYQIRLKLEPDLMTILGEDEDVGDRAVETMPCLYSGATFEIGFNYNYLEQAVQNIESASGEEEVLFTFSESNKPALVKPNIESDDLLMLIMPVRL